jgi:hypothetical protein
MIRNLTVAAIAAAAIATSATAGAQQAQQRPADRDRQRPHHEEEYEIQEDYAITETPARAPEEQKARDEQKRQEQAPPSTAERIGQATTRAAETVIGAARDVTRATDEPGEFSPLAVELNPLGLIVGGRISLNVEYAPVRHHIIVLSPHFVNTSAEIAVSPQMMQTRTFTGGGAEIGYRYYNGQNGVNGVFFGPSLIGGVFNASLTGEDNVFANIGVAADIGFQDILFDRLVLGAGVGIQYLRVSDNFDDLPAGPSAIASSGIKPRLLAQAGYAF